MSESTGRLADRLRNRLLWSMLAGALFSWQSAVIIALTIILFGLGFPPFSGWPIAWLLFGVVALVIFVVATLTDPKAKNRLLSQILSERYNPAEIQNMVARQRLEKALEYYAAIQSLIPTRAGASQVEFQNTLDEIDDWVAHLHELGKRVDQFEDNHIINRDRMQARNELDALHRRLKVENDAQVKDAIERSIQMKETQLNNLMTLESNVKRADIQMDNTLAALGTVYAQLQLIGSKDIDRARAQRLRNEVHDQVASLQDTIAAIDEVHGLGMQP